MPLPKAEVPRINFPLHPRLREQLNSAARSEEITVRDLLPLLARAYVQLRKDEGRDFKPGANGFILSRNYGAKRNVPAS